MINRQKKTDSRRGGLDKLVEVPDLQLQAPDMIQDPAPDMYQSLIQLLLR